MRQMLFTLLVGLTVGLFSSPDRVRAESPPLPMPGDNRLVKFVYNPNETYTVLTRPESATHLEMAPDEDLDFVVLGDTFQWVVSKTPKHFFIKPIKPDIFTSATIVTTKRTYQLTFRASAQNGKWMQHVGFHYPEIEMLQRVKSEAVAQRAVTEAQIESNATVASGLTIDKMKFDYVVEGAANIRPVTVFDDGRFTYIRFQPNAQELPALFMKEADGSLSLVNYQAKGDLMVVQRLVSRFLLKLGKDEVTITKADAVPAAGGLFNWLKR